VAFQAIPQHRSTLCLNNSNSAQEWLHLYISSKIVVSSRLSGAPHPLTQQAPLQAVKLQTKSLLKISSETIFS
jgi:hypothetical protein